jgi:hypothetical protein
MNIEAHKELWNGKTEVIQFNNLVFLKINSRFYQTDKMSKDNNLKEIDYRVFYLIKELVGLKEDVKRLL